MGSAQAREAFLSCSPTNRSAQMLYLAGQQRGAVALLLSFGFSGGSAVAWGRGRLALNQHGTGTRAGLGDPDSKAEAHRVDSGLTSPSTCFVSRGWLLGGVSEWLCW